MMRAASIVFGLFTVGLLGYAGYVYVTDRDPPPGEALVVDAPERDLGSQPCDAEIPVRFRLSNASSRPIRVLGLVRGCGRNSCFGPKHLETFEIPARSHFELECEATTYKPGEFRSPMYVNYHDGSDYHQVELSITGTAVAPRVADHASKTP